MPRKKSAPETKPVTEMYPHKPVIFRQGDPDIEAVIEEVTTREDRRMDLESRLDAAAKAFREIVLPHYGKRPECFTPEQWEDRREKGLSPPPESAPSEARDASNGLRTINHIRWELRALRGDPAAADRATIGGQSDAALRMACWAIDLGLLLQRCDAQLSFGQLVAAGISREDGRDTGNKTVSQRAIARKQLAHAEYTQRMGSLADPSRMKTATLKNMKEVKGEDGKPLYGPFHTLKKWAKDW